MFYDVAESNKIVDRLSAVYTNSPEFRRLIEERRREQSIAWDEAKKQLDLGA